MPIFIRIVIVIIFCFSISTLLGQSNEGKAFWFAFMEHVDPIINTKVVMITAKTNTSGTVSVPNRGWSETFTVSANSVTIIKLPDFTEVLGSESIENVGVKLVSQNPVSVYIHQYNNFRSEATLVLPISSIDKEYFVMCYNGLPFGSAFYPSEFLVVATQDETTITITPAGSTRGGVAGGTSFDIVLDEGEVYQVQGNSGLIDLTGSHIKGDKDFSVFGGNSWAQVECSARDNLLEQMYPVSTWGRQFVNIPSANVVHDRIRILASEDNTQIRIDGIDRYTLNRGEFVEYVEANATYINSTKPVLVAKYNIGSFCSGHSVGDPSFLLLNSIEQTRDTVTLYNSSFENISENYIDVVMPTSDIQGITFDNQPISTFGTINIVGLNGEFSYITIPVTTGAHTIISQGCGVIASAYGYGQAESYAYGGGASFSSINGDPIPDGGCLNDTIIFDADLSPLRYAFEWDISDGVTSTEPVFTHIYTALGTYPVQLIITDLCLGLKDTLNKDIIVSLRQAVSASGDTTLCEFGDFDLFASDLAGAKYEWTGPNNYFSEEQFPTLTNAVVTQTGTYEVVGIISGCATFPALVDVNVIATPKPNLGEDRVYCNEDTITVLDPGSYAQYLWQDNSIGFTYEVEEEGKYWVEVTDGFGCVGSDTVTLQNICPTSIYIPDAFTPNFDGINDEFGVLGTNFIKVELDIFDRWGNHIFHGDTPNEHWDGTFRGKHLDSGVYVWQVKIEGYNADGTTFSTTKAGNVTMIRSVKF